MKIAFWEQLLEAELQKDHVRKAWVDVLFSEDIFPSLALTSRGSQVLEVAIEVIVYGSEDEYGQLLGAEVENRPDSEAEIESRRSRRDSESRQLMRRLPALFRLILPEENAALLLQKHGSFPCIVLRTALLHAAKPDEAWAFLPWFDMDKWEDGALTLVSDLRLVDAALVSDLRLVDDDHDEEDDEEGDWDWDEDEDEEEAGQLLELFDKFVRSVGRRSDVVQAYLDRHFTPEIIHAVHRMRLSELGAMWLERILGPRLRYRA